MIGFNLISKNKNEGFDGFLYGTWVDIAKLTYVDYLLPMDVSPNPTEISIPESYLFLLSCLLNLKYHKYKANLTDLDLKDVPPLKLNIKYEDIGENSYEKNYSIQFAVYIYRTDEAGALTYITSAIYTSEMKKKRI